MTSENRISRLAGLLYLIVVITGLFSLAYVPAHINVAGDPQATIARIVASEALFRFGIAAFLVKQVAFLLLPLVLYRLLRRVDEATAVAMVALAVVSVPIALVSLVNRFDVLTLLTDPRSAAVFTPEQLHTQASRALIAYRNGLGVTNLFWGLWLLPFGYLVLKSGFLPRVLGVLLMLGCLGYVVDVFGGLLLPHYSETWIADFALTPAGIGEIGTCLWLLLVGARPRNRDGTRAATA